VEELQVPLVQQHQARVQGQLVLRHGLSAPAVQRQAQEATEPQVQVVQALLIVLPTPMPVARQD
jgi:hypothetical protein